MDKVRAPSEEGARVASVLWQPLSLIVGFVLAPMSDDNVAPEAPEPQVICRNKKYRTMREAVHVAAHSTGSIKTLAADLDMAPSALSMSTVLADGEHVRPFPVEKLVELCTITQDHSPLFTLADSLGYAVVRRDDLANIAETLARCARDLKEGR